MKLLSLIIIAATLYIAGYLVTRYAIDWQPRTFGNYIEFNLNDYRR